jgi:anti-sigma factor RsiW
MNCKECTERIVEFSDGRLDEAHAGQVREHLASCPSCREEQASLAATLRSLDTLPIEAPSHRMRARLMGAIESERIQPAAVGDERVRRPAAAPFPWFRALAGGLGACLLLAVGFILGERAATQRQIADLRSRVDTMGQLVEQSVLQKVPAGDRLETVLTAGASQRPDEHVIDGLINAMAFDPSVNVRLNALNALYAHSRHQVVRAGVLACLPRETNPLVQISMIDFLVAAKAQEASGELTRLASDPAVDSDVRDAAHRAVELL